MNQTFWPNNKKFCFTIIDDTDNSYLNNAPIIYEYLSKKKILTTKTVWVRNGDDSFEYNSVNGTTLGNREYINWVKKLESEGFEICLHNMSWSSSTRAQIKSGFKNFEKLFGRSRILIQHNDEKECESIYWGSKRLVFPMNIIFEIVSYLNPRGKRSKIYNGENKNSIYFWGDICKEKVDFIRNFTFPEINLFNITKKIIHKRRKTKYVKNWFISTEAPDLKSFVKILNPKNIDKLEIQNGLCIIYTHFGNNFVKDGKLNAEFKKTIDYLANKNGWFVPASEIFDHIKKNTGEPPFLSYFQELKLSIQWLLWKIFKGSS